ncbi:MAG: hypothetical protein LQ350_000336 [Teloschistes chrysophthalmus]|nr:MAG: hypothetical protein LQ350_000336 [Niorma chrysophthalma]
MVAIGTVLRTVGATVTLVATTALLSYPLSHRIHKSARVQDVFGHSPSTVWEPINLSTPDTDHVKTLALPFRHEYFTPGFSSPAWVKRAPPPILTYDDAVCKGGNYWTDIQQAFDGNRPAGPVFSIQSATANGWDIMATAQGITNANPDSEYIELDQGSTFKNKVGKRIDDPTYAYYNQHCLSDVAAIISTWSLSPSAALKGRRNPPPAGEIPNLIPPFHRLSDVQWTYWSDVAGNNVGRLRFLGRDHIINENTTAIIKNIFRAQKEVELVPWPGLSFSIETNEAKALLATPNSVNAVWLMRDRAAVLGMRRPMVTIWTQPETNYICMLWDLAPA